MGTTQLKDRHGKEIFAKDLIYSKLSGGGNLTLGEAMDQAKMALFVDMVQEAGAKYDPANAPDAEHPFYLNELWLTYKEMLTVHRESSGSRYWYPFSKYINCNARTFYTLLDQAGSYAYNLTTGYQFKDCVNLEIIRFATNSPYRVFTDTTFNRCNKLRKIITMGVQVSTNTFTSCPLLEEVNIYHHTSDLNLSNNPLLSLGSFQFLISNAVNTKEITITVHADVYAKLIDPAQPEWAQLLLDAQARQIAFAT